jgi:hypothetical protein
MDNYKKRNKINEEIPSYTQDISTKAGTIKETERSLGSNITNTKYSKSVSGLQCIGPCVSKNKKIIHPVTLETVTDKDNAFCPVAGFEIINEKTNKKEIKYTDKCYGVQVDTIDNNTQIMNVLIPELEFDVKHFLIMFYNIHSYEEGIEWINNNLGSPLTTRERIFECILNTYGFMIDIIDNRTSEFVLLLIKNKFIDKIYDRFQKYIYVDLYTKTVKIKVAKQSDNEENRKIKLEFIYKKYINLNEINKFLYKYFRERKKNWFTINHHVKNIIDDFILYTIKSINISIEYKPTVQ